MCDMGKIIKFICKDCKLFFWVNPEDEPRFCPFCESGLIEASDN